MNDDAQLERLLERWKDSVKKGAAKGTPIDLDSLCADYPELRNRLKEKIEVLESETSHFESDRLPEQGTERSPTVGSPAMRTPPPSIRFESTFRDLQYHDRGGIGIVYQALDLGLNRSVAIKLMQPKFIKNDQLVARFRQEAEITGRLDHPGVVPVYALGQTDQGQPFIAMRFIRGEPLDSAIESYHNERAAMDPDRARRELRKLLGCFVSVCRTIAYAHTRGIVHRDIKPQNIMLGKYGETLVVDWGLAVPIDRESRFRVTDETTLRPQLEKGLPTNVQEGTPVYMSPEQVSGRSQILPASDIFSLGVTLYKLLTGELAFDGDSPQEVRLRILQVDFPAPHLQDASIPPDLEAIVLKAMAADPKDRYETASDLAEDIERWLADGAVLAYEYSALDRLGRWCRNRRGLARVGLVLLGLASLGLVGAAIAFLYFR